MSKMKITLVRSIIGKPKDQKATIQALGFRRLNQTIEVVDNPQTRGMVKKVNHLLSIEKA